MTSYKKKVNVVKSGDLDDHIQIVFNLDGIPEDNCNLNLLVLIKLIFNFKYIVYPVLY